MAAKERNQEAGHRGDDYDEILSNTQQSEELKRMSIQPTPLKPPQAHGPTPFSARINTPARGRSHRDPTSAHTGRRAKIVGLNPIIQTRYREDILTSEQDLHEVASSKKVLSTEQRAPNPTNSFDTPLPNRSGQTALDAFRAEQASQNSLFGSQVEICNVTPTKMVRTTPVDKNGGTVKEVISLVHTPSAQQDPNALKCACVGIAPSPEADARKGDVIVEWRLTKSCEKPIPRFPKKYTPPPAKTSDAKKIESTPKTKAGEIKFPQFTFPNSQEIFGPAYESQPNSQEVETKIKLSKFKINSRMF